MATSVSVNGHDAAPPAPPKKLLNHIVDDMAREKPDVLYAEIPLSPTSFDAGFRRVTYRALANAINGMAWWLHRTLGPGQNFETLLYIGPNDLRHNILILGAVKAGYKVRKRTQCKRGSCPLEPFADAGPPLDVVHIAPLQPPCPGKSNTTGRLQDHART